MYGRKGFYEDIHDYDVKSKAQMLSETLKFTEDVLKELKENNRLLKRLIELQEKQQG